MLEVAARLLQAWDRAELACPPTHGRLRLIVLLQAWDRVGMPTHMRKAQLGRLVGTHAHEQSMLVQQLLAHFDQQAGDVARLHGTVGDGKGAVFPCARCNVALAGKSGWACAPLWVLHDAMAKANAWACAPLWVLHDAMAKANA